MKKICRSCDRDIGFDTIHFFKRKYEVYSMTHSFDRSTTVCFTGSRPNKMYGYQRDAYQPLVNQLVLYVKQRYEQGFRNFITGGAQGFDQCVFWAIHIAKITYQLPIQNILCSPFPGQERKWLETGLFSQAEYRQMCQYADCIIPLHDHENLSSYAEVAKALNERNEHMCNLSSLLIGFWDATIDPNSIQKSGTANCLKYALNIQLPIQMVHPKTYQLTNYTSAPLPPMMFHGAYDFLSNMYPCPVSYQNETFSCTEIPYHLYRIKEECTIVRDQFRNCKTGYEAKALNNRYKKSGQLKQLKRPDWEQINLQLMYDLVYAKFSQNPELKIKLLQTGTIELVENNTWHDTFWGVCNGIGENHLGKILMQIRSELH